VQKHGYPCSAKVKLAAMAANAKRKSRRGPRSKDGYSRVQLRMREGQFFAAGTASAMFISMAVRSR
jgi:hypothetical protein